MDESAPRQKQILYFGDPMCSWCWGFAPVLEQISRLCAGRAKLHLIMGGLRPGSVVPWDEGLRSSIRHHWQSVSDASGQPFDFARFDDQQFIYDTEPACRALVSVRNVEPNKSLAMFEALQRSFYAEDLDITQTNVLSEIAESVGVDKSVFLNLFNHHDTQSLTNGDFVRTRNFGVQGFPSILCQDGETILVLTSGYQSYSALVPQLEEWLNA